MTTKSQVQAEDCKALMRARNPLIYIRTPEEVRVEGYLYEACAAAKYVTRTWDCAAGARELNGEPVQRLQGVTDIGATLDYIRDVAIGEQPAERCAWILRDLHKWVDGPLGITTCRQLRNLARMLPGVRDPNRWQTLIVVAPEGELPPDLRGDAIIIDWPLPDRDEIAGILDRIAKVCNVELNGQREAAIDAAVGMSGLEAEACYAKSMVQTKNIDPAIVAGEKKKIIARDKVLEWMDPLEGGFDAVGGLDVVKTWITARALANTPRARAYGLKPLKGIFLAGVSGCGKTYIAKAIAWALGRLPLVRLDLGALKGKYVGESEARIRKAFQIIDNLGPCVVLVDEIEKALAGATQGAADGGVSADALGAFLTWMQERKSPAFVIATANDVTGLPPEIMRKGRWDELFWVDLPVPRERTEIIRASLRGAGRDPETLAGEFTWEDLARATDQFTGAEIAALVPEALFVGFNDGERAITLDDLLQAAEQITPLAETAREKIDAMRKWAKGRARPATTPETETQQPAGRVLDLA